MSAFDRSSRLPVELPDLLTDIAAPRVPDYVDDVLAITAGARQRPRWTFPERWIPMGVIATERVSVRTPIPWRTLAVVALAILTLVAAGVFYVGSRPHRPAPFGPARNGALLVSQNGDIWVRDSIDGSSRLLIGGPTDDYAASFTRDGTRILYLRRTAGTENMADERLVVVGANADGSNPTVLTRELTNPLWIDLSPDDSTAVVEQGDPGRLFTFSTTQPGELKPLEVGDPDMAMDAPSFLGPDGTEIVFHGQTLVGGVLRAGMFAVHPNGSGLRPLTPTDGDPANDYQFPQVSPDGRFLTYMTHNPATDEATVHLVEVRTGGDRVLDADLHQSERLATFSPDGSHLLFMVDTADASQMTLQPVGGGASIPIGPRFNRRNMQLSIQGMFSPDGTSIVVNEYGSSKSWLVDATTGGDGQLLSWSPAGISGWQRLGP
jgi:hypothetical protein